MKLLPLLAAFLFGAVTFAYFHERFQPTGPSTSTSQPTDGASPPARSAVYRVMV